MEYTGILLNMDNIVDLHKDRFDPESHVVIKDEILVTVGFDKDRAVGKASVTKDGGVLRYTLELYPDKITKELAENLFPCVGGSITSRQGDTVNGFTVKVISLCLDNADERIKTLGESNSGK